MISDEAIEAAAKVMGLEMGTPSSWTIYRHLARRSLEAASPHMQSEATDDALRAAWDRGYATAVEGMKDVPARAWDEGYEIGRASEHQRIASPNPYRGQA